MGIGKKEDQELITYMTCLHDLIQSEHICVLIGTAHDNELLVNSTPLGMDQNPLRNEVPD